jgi:predicted MFS family arabinose efflux permease
MAGVRLRGRRRCAGVGAAGTANQTLLITQVTPEQRAASFALGRVASNLGLGIGIGATVAGFIISSAQHLRSFQTIYVFDAITYAAFALVVLAVVPNRRAAAAHASAVGGGFRAVARDAFTAP